MDISSKNPRYNNMDKTCYGVASDDGEYEKTRGGGREKNENKQSATAIIERSKIKPLQTKMMKSRREYS